MSDIFGHHTVLLVDDENFTRSVVSQMLRRLGFAEVIVALDGYHAIDVLNKRNVSLVITDFRMPGIHGLELLKRIRTGKTGAVRNLPCAMLTSYAERHLVGLAIVLDVDSFLAKPVGAPTLTKHLTRCFQYRFEPLDVDAYEQVDVENAAPHLTGPRPVPTSPPAEEEITEEEALGPKPQVVLKTPKEPKPERQKATAPQQAEKSEPTTPARKELPPSSPAQPKAMKKVALAEVPENAVIAKDLVGSGGTLLLAAGTPFRARYAKRIEELQEKIEHVWILEE